MLTIFSVPFYWLFICLWRNIDSSPLSIFELSLYRLSSLYSLSINPLSNVWFENILFCRLLFYSVVIVFRYTKFLKQTWRPVFCCCCSLCFWCYIQGIIAKSNVMKLVLLFSSKSFIVLSLIFTIFCHV